MDTDRMLILNTLRKSNIAVESIDYSIKISENYVPIEKIKNIFKIRYRIAKEKGNDILVRKISDFLKDLENSPSDIDELRIVSIQSKSKISIFYLNKVLDMIIGKIEGNEDPK